MDSDGQPIEGALVLADPEQPEDPPYLEPYEQPERLHPAFDRAATRTDAEGLARFLMPVTEAHVAVSAPGFALRTANATGGRAAFRLDPAPGIALRVRGQDGRPARRAAIRTASEPLVPLALTDERGEATVSSAVDGRAAFEAETAGGAFARALVRNRPSQDGASEASIVEVQLQPPTAAS